MSLLIRAYDPEQVRMVRAALLEPFKAPASVATSIERSIGEAIGAAPRPPLLDDEAIKARRKRYERLRLRKFDDFIEPALRKYGPMSVNRLHAQTGLAWGTLRALEAELVSAGRIVIRISGDGHSLWVLK